MSNSFIFVIAGDVQVLDEENFLVNEESLKQFVLSESLTTDLSTLVTILVGLEGCQKEDVLRHFLKEEVDPKGERKKLAEVGERNMKGLSHYEFAVAGDSQKPGLYDWSFFMRSTGYLKCFISAFLQQAERKNCCVDAVQPPMRGKFFDEPILDEHFHIILEGLHSHFSKHQPEKDDTKLLEGLCLVNIWDIENPNKAVKLVLSMLAGKLKESLVLLGHNLVKQVRMPNDQECMELLRFAHLAKDDDADRPGASIGIGLVAPSQTPTEEEVAELPILLKNLVMRNAKIVGVEGCVRENPEIFDAKSTRSIKQSLEMVANMLTGTKSIPLSWILLRSAFFKSGMLYVEKETLKKVSSKLEITENKFEEFLVLFTATGSLIYNPRIPALGKYIVLNLVDFCYCLKSLFKARFDGDLKRGVVPMSYLRRIFGSDAEFFREILVSSKHAIEVEMKRIKYPTGSRPPPLPEHPCFFIPIIRKRVQEVKKHASALYLQVKSTFLPNNVGQILVERLLRDASIWLVPTKISNMVSFEYKAKDGQGFINFSVIFHADACEIHIEPGDGCKTLAVQSVKSLLINSCCFVKSREKEMFVPFGTEVLGIGVMCTTRGGFHCFPCTGPCQECAVAVKEWQPIYDKVCEQYCMFTNTGSFYLLLFSCSP